MCHRDIYHTWQMFLGENFLWFLRFFSQSHKFSALTHLLCTVHDGLKSLDLMHCKSFPVNSVFCAQPRKFSPSKHLPSTVLNSVVATGIVSSGFDKALWYIK